jgi:hypothetical protein
LPIEFPENFFSIVQVLEIFVVSFIVAERVHQICQLVNLGNTQSFFIFAGKLKFRNLSDNIRGLFLHGASDLDFFDDGAGLGF